MVAELREVKADTAWKMMDSNSELARAVDQGNDAALRRAVAAGAAKTIRFLSAQLYSNDERTKWKAVRALGVVVGERQAVSDNRARELLRRFFWWLSDESGAVPFGVAEAVGEVLAVRIELQPDYLPRLCSLTHHPELLQTGDIERGVFWALGRVGKPAAICSPEALETVTWAAGQHPDVETRKVAAWALNRFRDSGIAEPG